MMFSYHSAQPSTWYVAAVAGAVAGAVAAAAVAAAAVPCGDKMFCGGAGGGGDLRGERGGVCRRRLCPIQSLTFRLL